MGRYHFDTYLNSNEMVAMTDTERKVAELNALIDAVEGGTNEAGNVEGYGPVLIYDKFDSSKVKMYAYMLEDINPVTLAEAIKQCINTCEFVPAVATIRKKAGRNFRL